MWDERTYWVYILASGKHRTLYVGITNSLERRIMEHRERAFPGFTSKYGVTRLVWYRGHGEVTEAIHFEKLLKRWRREWKIQLIEEGNPGWDDLYAERIAPEPDNRCLWVPDSRWRGFRDDTKKMK
jgi:putative endonuclease